MINYCLMKDLKIDVARAISWAIYEVDNVKKLEGLLGFLNLITKLVKSDWVSYSIESSMVFH